MNINQDGNARTNVTVEGSVSGDVNIQASSAVNQCVSLEIWALPHSTVKVCVAQNANAVVMIDTGAANVNGALSIGNAYAGINQWVYILLCTLRDFLHRGTSVFP